MLSRRRAHPISNSFDVQVLCLKSARYPPSEIVTVAESMSRRQKATVSLWNEGNQVSEHPQKVAFIMHGIAHNLKKIGGGANVKVAMSAPVRLSKLCLDTCPVKREKSKCLVKHPYVCQTHLPFSCGRPCIGQTACCLNHHLCKHAINLKEENDGN